MITLIAIASFALVVATSAEAMTPAQIPQPESVTGGVELGCLRGQNNYPSLPPVSPQMRIFGAEAFAVVGTNELQGRSRN
jgi:hypothetical protein